MRGAVCPFGKMEVRIYFITFVDPSGLEGLHRYTFFIYMERLEKRLLCLVLVLCFCFSAQAQRKDYRGDGIDDYLRFVPVASAVALKAAGVESSSSWKRFAVNAALSVAISSGVTYGLKHTVHDMRPDGTDNRSFPSGHTSFAFAGATVLHKEFHRVSPWISVAGFGVAALTAADRVRRHRHEWDDVAAGAAIGIVGTELGYWLGDKITGERSRYDVAVGPQEVTLVVRL